MHKRLTRNFYIQPTLKVAKDLLGKYIVRKIGNRKLTGKIIETEAYVGPQDRASHAYKGKRTPRNRAEYLIGGHIYIYLVYGMYWQMNISTHREGKPECVLIRAIEPVPDGLKRKAQSVKRKTTIQNSKLLKLTNGPGKVCRWFKLDKSFYGEDLTKSKRIWLEDPAPEQARYGAGRGEKIKPLQILAAKRIGIDYAGPYWAEKKWRFLFKDYKKYLPK